MIDSACRLWKIECDEQSSCWVYDNTDIAHRLVAILVGFKSVSIIMNILALKMYKAPNIKTNFVVKEITYSVSVVDTSEKKITST